MDFNFVYRMNYIITFATPSRNGIFTKHNLRFDKGTTSKRMYLANTSRITRKSFHHRQVRTYTNTKRRFLRKMRYDLYTTTCAMYYLFAEARLTIYFEPKRIDHFCRYLLFTTRTYIQPLRCRRIS